MKLKTTMTHKAVFSSHEIETIALVLNCVDAYLAQRDNDDTYERAAETLLAILDSLDDGQAEAVNDVACALADAPTPDKYPEIC